MELRWSARVGIALGVILLTVTASPGASQPAVSIINPRDGATISGHNVPLAVEIKGLKVDCESAGKGAQPGIGHWHVFLDGGLVDMACGPGYLVSLRNVKPGRHALMVVPALNDHAEVEKAAATVTFTYQPEEPLPILTGLRAGRPRLSVASPKNGATVTGQTFPLVLNVENFRLSCELFGKPQLANTGHWHVHLDKMASGMEGMATMMSMGCSNTVEVPLKGVSPGSHTIIVVLVDNKHYPITPMTSGQVTVRVK